MASTENRYSKFYQHEYDDVISSLKKKQATYNNLPLKSKSPWDIRSLEEAQNLLSNPLIEIIIEFIKNQQMFADKADESALKKKYQEQIDDSVVKLIQLITLNVGMSIGATRILMRYIRYDKPLSLADYYDGPIRVILPLQEIILPSQDPKSDYQQWSKDTGMKSTDFKSAFLLDCELGTNREDIEYFIKEYWPLIKPITQLSFSKYTRIRRKTSIQRDKMRQVVLLRLKGFSITQIAVMTNLDNKTVHNILVSSDIDGPLGEHVQKLLQIGFFDLKEIKNES